ncbi:MAG: hypothetical protein WCJ30_02060 [Deltaproteobacteria bacterium]
MGSERSRQKKLAKQKRKRLEVKKAADRGVVRLPRRSAALGRRAAAWPVVGAYMSRSWRRESALPELVIAALVRLAPTGDHVLGMFIVDRTCFGIKSGFVRAMSQEMVDNYLEQGSEPLEAVELAMLQSVAFHGADYARSLGFQGDPDFPLEFLGARPEPLVDTLLAKPARPHFVSGPYDNVPAVFAQLTRVVGAGNFDTLMGGPLGFDLYDGGDDELDDGEDDDDDDLDVVEGVGELVKP